MQLVIKNLLSDMNRVELATKFKSFGDEHSTLLDQYERLSFEVQLNKAMLGRSFSSPATARRLPPPPVPLVAKPVSQGKRRHESSFQKMIKKLFRPILGSKGSRKDTSATDRKDPSAFLKAFSRSRKDTNATDGKDPSTFLKAFSRSRKETNAADRKDPRTLLKAFSRSVRV